MRDSLAVETLAEHHEASAKDPVKEEAIVEDTTGATISLAAAE
jgi:hypothetical protein